MMNSRFQHPQVKARKDRPGWPWIFRYRAEELQPDGSLRTLRKYCEVGPSKGKGALTLKQAEAARDELLALNAPACLASAASAVNDSKTIAPSPSEPVAFGRFESAARPRVLISIYQRLQNVLNNTYY